MPNLKELRELAGVTQAELAALSGLRQATISAIEKGRSQPRAGTLRQLAVALKTDVEVVQLAAVESRPVLDPKGQLGTDWRFMRELSTDLRQGLAQALVADWTHSSTALEGNTISAGDTLFILSEGLTVSGKSLREHQEIHGHAQALALMTTWTREGNPIRTAQLHELHRAVQTGTTVDYLAPVGSWKIEPNGTNALTTGGKRKWHDYAAPAHVPTLVDSWLKLLANSKHVSPLQSYTDLHLGFTRIHPYADGNGRMARLLANISILRSGEPPLLINAEERKTYLTLMGDYSINTGSPKVGEPLVSPGAERSSLEDFFASQWETTRGMVAEFHERQKNR